MKIADLMKKVDSVHRTLGDDEEVVARMIHTGEVIQVYDLIIENDQLVIYLSPRKS